MPFLLIQLLMVAILIAVPGIVSPGTRAPESSLDVPIDIPQPAYDDRDVTFPEPPQVEQSVTTPLPK